jgi:hypothetical protein
VLIHGTGRAGAFNRPPPQQIEIPQRSRGGLGVGDADQEQRLNQTEEGLSHDAHSTICATAAWKLTPHIMTALGLAGYPSSR